MKFKIGVLIFSVLFALSSAAAFANTVPPYTPEKTFWVDGTSSSTTYGNDANSGLTEALAKRTITAAITAAEAAARTSAGQNWGHIIIVKAGTYAGQLDLDGASLKNLIIMSYSTNPANVIITTGAVGEAAIIIEEDNIKIVGVTIQAITSQTASLVQVPGTGGKGLDFNFYNCVFDQNTVTTTSMTKGLVDLTLAVALNHNEVTGPEFENCTFDISDGTSRGITVAGASVLQDLYIKGCSFTGKGALTADLTSNFAIFIDDDAKFTNMYITGNHFKYSNIKIEVATGTTGGAANNMDGLRIYGNYFDQGDGVWIFRDGVAFGENKEQFNVVGLFITGNNFRLNDVAATTRRADSYALNLQDINDTEIKHGILFFQYNNIEVKQKSDAADANPHVRTTARTTDFLAAAINNNYWWGTGIPASSAVNLGPYITTTEFTTPSTNWTAGTTNIPALVPSSGIEMFDMDNNGHIDKAVVYMSKRINPGSVPDYTASNKDGLNIGSGYTITRAVIETGITSTASAIAIYFTEKYDFDTAALPQVTYTSASDAGTKLGGLSVSAALVTEQTATWTELTAGEVDKAKPVLVKAETLDTGKGTGTAGNGMLDAIQFTFSEEVFNVRTYAGLATEDSFTGLVNDLADSNFVVSAGDISFNQGSRNLTAGTSVYTLAVGEVRLNTGLTPTVLYQLGNDDEIAAAFMDVVSDHALSATGAPAYNLMYVASMGTQDDLTINVLDNAALVAASAKTADTGYNGRIDQITVTFSEPVDLSFNNGAKVAFYTTVPNFGTDPTTLPGYYTIGTGGSAPVTTGSVITFTLVENATATAPYDTEAVPEFRYTPNTTAGQKIMDLAGVQLAAYGSNVSGGKVLTTTDGAAPVLLKITTKDAFVDTSFTGVMPLYSSGPDGRIDTVTLRFSEAVKTDNAAEVSGATTALNSAIAQFTLTHPLAGAGVRTKVTTAANYGKPTWLNTGVSGDTTSEINISFEEVSYGLAALTNNGDTGSKITAAYGALAAVDNIKDAAGNLIVTASAVTVDGAAPFLVQGTGRGWGSNAFTNVKTVDSDGAILNGGGGDTANGNGFIDGFLLEFTETVKINSGVAANTVTAVDSLGCFTTTLSKGGTLLFSVGKGKISVNTATAASEITLTGLASETTGAWNTEITPTLVYAPSATLGTVYDAVTVTATQPVNVMAGCSRVASDGARPVIVNLLQNGSVATELEVTFSESVWGHYPAALTRNALIDSLQIASSVLFKYEDTKAGGATTASATYIRKKTDNQWIVTLDAALTADDISTSSFWCKENSYIYDDANANDSGILDNDLKGLLAGTNLKIMIMDDVVKPFIDSITTVDANGNGYIDHLRIGLNEAVKDTTIGGYVRQNTLSTDVAAKYIITGYTGGTVLFNFFAPDNAGKDAAIAAGEPVFSDNLLDDAVLYIKLEESKITKYAGTNLGSTNYTGTMSLSSPTLIDKSARANVLDTTFGTVAAAAKGKIVDAVAPVLMSAEWANSKVNLSFSEAVEDTGAILKDVQFSIMDTYLYGYTFTPSTGADKSSWAINAAVLPTVTAETANFRKKIDNILWKDKGRIELTMRSGWAWPADKALGIQLASFDLGPGTLCVFKDAAVAADGTTAAENAAVLYGADPKGTATWYAAGDKAHPWPYDTVPQYDYVGLKLITGIPSIKLTAPSAINAMVGQSVDVTWTSTNIDSVDVWVSKNLGISFTKIAGARTVATAAKYVWTVSSGANYVQISSKADSAVCSKSGLITIISGEAVVTPTGPVGAPSNLVLTDVPNDNGHWMFATFTKSADHLTRVKSYQFYREVNFGTTAVPDLKWVYSAVVPAGVVTADNKMVCLVPSIINGVARWAVVASTGDVVTDLSVAAKEAGIAVAMVVDAAEKAAAEVVLSAMSAVAEGGAIDNIAPSAIVTFAADDNEGAGAGVKLSWTAPEDHGIVGTYGWAGVGTFPIYGVDEYQVYRREKTTDSFVLVGAATPLSTSYVDAVSDGGTIYQYMVKAVDSAHTVETTTKNALAFIGGADFTSDGVVGLGDLVLFGNQWNVKSTDANWVSAFDLNADGTVGLGDLVLLGNAWTVAGKVAKEALPVTSDVALTMSANYDGTSSIYYVNIAANKVDGFNGVGFTMSYDADALELVKDGITGLGAVSITREAEAGMVDVNSYFMDKEFTGTVTVAFKSKGMSKNFDFELVNASVSIDNVISAVSKLASVTVQAVPTVYSISQNFPNPFNPTTTIEYSIPQAGNVELVIYNMAGQKVRTLVNENQPAAYTKVVWDGRNDMGETVGAGMYFYKLVSGNFSKIQKMTLIK